MSEWIKIAIELFPLSLLPAYKANTEIIKRKKIEEEKNASNSNGKVVHIHRRKNSLPLKASCLNFGKTSEMTYECL